MTLDLIGRVEAAELYDDLFVVSAHGPMDSRCAGVLRDLLVTIAAADGAAVLLDLEDAHGLDTETLGVVGVAAHLAARRGVPLKVVTRSLHIQELFDSCGLDAIVEVVPSLRDAIGR